VAEVQLSPSVLSSNFLLGVPADRRGVMQITDARGDGAPPGSANCPAFARLTQRSLVQTRT